MQIHSRTKTNYKGGSVMIEQYVFLFCGLTPMGMQLYRLVGAFPDCEPLLIMNQVDPNLLRNPSKLKYEVVRRGSQVPYGGIGVGKRCDWQGDLVDGYEIVSVLAGIEQAEVQMHPDLIKFPSYILQEGPESPAPIDGPVGGVADLKAPEAGDKVVDSQDPISEEMGNEPSDDVHAVELPVGQSEGNGAADACGNKPSPIKTRKGPSN